MAQLLSSYLVSGRALSTELDPQGSTLLGAVEGLDQRLALASSVMQSATVTPSQIVISLKDGSQFFLKGSFNTAFETTSPSELISRTSGTINEIWEVEYISPSTSRYLLTDVSISIKEYFSSTTWEDVLTGNDRLIGGIGYDQLIDYGGHSVFEGLNGNDHLYAKENSNNLAIFSGSASEYIIDQNVELNHSNFVVSQDFTVEDLVANRDGKDSLINIERLQFLDTNIAFDTSTWDNAGSAYRLYTAAFDRAPDEVGLGYWIDRLDDGASLQEAANGFLISNEFKSLYGANSSDTLFLTKLYNNVLDRDPDQGGLNYWISKLNGGMSRESALINFSESDENISNVADIITNGIQYQAWLG